MAENPSPNKETTSASRQHVNVAVSDRDRAITATSRLLNNIANMSFQPVNAPAAADTGSTSTAVVASSGGQAAKVDATPADPDGPYGTRSRNRTRINYAEDQEMDLEYSSAATTKKKASTHHNNPPPLGPSVAETKRASESTKLTTHDGGVPHTYKESTPGSSGAPATSSKKRKAAGALPQHSQPPPANAAAAPSVARKSGLSASTSASASASASSTKARETNVMTFTKHKSCLNKRGELVADDGQKLSVNGKSPFLEVQALPRLNQHQRIKTPKG